MRNETAGSKSRLDFGIVDGWIDVFKYIQTTRYQDAILGIVCLTILLGLRALDRTQWLKVSKTPAPGPQTLFNKLPPTLQTVVSKVVWFLCTSRNAVVVVLSALIAGAADPDCIQNEIAKKAGNFSGNMTCIWSLTGSIKEGLPPLQLPPFSTVSGDTLVTFEEMVSKLGAAIIVIPLLSILESIAIAKAFAGGIPVDASQEMIAVGISNICGSFVSSMPVAGSFSRTAVNAASGVKTPLGGLFTGALVILCLAVLIPFCALIPKATLAAVLVAAVIFSIEYQIVLPMWHSKKIDLVPAMVCLIVCLLYKLEIGILVGVVVQLFIVLHYSARPKMVIEVRKFGGGEYLYIAPDQGILYPSVTYVRNLINKSGFKQAGPNIPVVIDCSAMNQTDYTAAQGFRDMVKDINARNTEVYWLNPSPSVLHTLKTIAGDKFNVVYGEQEFGGSNNNNSNNSSSSPTYPPPATSSPLIGQEMV